MYTILHDTHDDDPTMSDDSLVPVTVLTGFLGSGKTTLVTAARATHSRPIANALIASPKLARHALDRGCITVPGHSWRLTLRAASCALAHPWL